MNGKPSNTMLIHGAVKALEYSLIPYLCIQVVNVIEIEKASKWVYILIGVNALFQVISISTGLGFYIDENNFYHQGSGYWVYVLICVFCGIYALLKCFKYEKHFQSSAKVILLIMMLLPIFGVVMRQINKEVRLEMMCIALTSIFLYIYYVGTLQKSDPLTGLLNRGSYIGKTSSLSEKSIIIYFDVDEFKMINDKYGHNYGDKILIIIGQLIKDVYGKYGLCYRIGGDEFCVILKEKMEDVEELNTEFKQLLKKNQKTQQHSLMVSLGYSIFDPQKNNIEDAIFLADKNMYSTKTKLRMALRETNERLYVFVRAFQIVAQESSALVFVYDLKKRRILVDERTAKAFGVSEEQDGVPYQTAKMGMVSEDTVDEYIRIHEEILNGAPKANGIVKLIQADGTQSIQELSFSAILNEDGKPTGSAVGVYLTVHDKE